MCNLHMIKNKKEYFENTCMLSKGFLDNIQDLINGRNTYSTVYIVCSKKRERENAFPDRNAV